MRSCHEQASFPSSLFLRYSATCFFYFLRFSCPFSLFSVPWILASAALLSLSGCISGLVPPTLSSEAAVIQARFTTKSPIPSQNKKKKAFSFTQHSLSEKDTTQTFLNSHTTTVPLENARVASRRSQARPATPPKGSSHSLSCQTTSCTHPCIEAPEFRLRCRSSCPRNGARGFGALFSQFKSFPPYWWVVCRCRHHLDIYLQQDLVRKTRPLLAAPHQVPRTTPARSLGNGPAVGFRSRVSGCEESA